MTKWNNLTPDTATAAEILRAGKVNGINENERCDLSDLLHNVKREVLFEMLDQDEHTALFLMSGSSMPTTTMIQIYNEHAGMMKPAEVQRIRDDYEGRIANLRNEIDTVEQDRDDAEHAAAVTEDRLHAAEHEIVVLKARLYDLLIGGKEKNENV